MMGRSVLSLPSAMSNKQLVAAYKKAEGRQTEINQKMINEGFCSLKFSAMRADPEVHPLAREYLALTDECAALGYEADLRYGPGLIIIEHLVVAQGAGYRRIKGGEND